MKWLDGYRMRLMFASFITVIVLGGMGPANGATITVGPGAGYDFDSIQAGVDAANDGDHVLVAPGEYLITEPITFRGKAITVRSEAGRDETTIQMGTPADTNRGSVVVFENGETIASVLDGFTITGGSGIPNPSEGNTGGGGIVFDASSGTVRNCAILQNRADGGGGVMAYSGSSVTMTHCAITGNSAGESGGGVIAYSGSSITLTNCIVRGNSAKDYGGGVFCGNNSSMTMTDCAITGNTATKYGGGLMCWEDSSVTMTDCIIRGNSATENAGGVFCNLRSSLTMTGCTIAENSAGESSGGVACWENSPMTLTNCTIVENSAAHDGGLCSGVNSPTIVINCTISGNSADTYGGGLSCRGGTSATVANSILWGNTAATGIGDEIHLMGQTPTEFSITYSNVAGGQAGVYVQGGSTLDWGAGNIDADPLLVDPANDDYHLKSQAGRWDPNSEGWVQDDVTSPCIDAGDPMSQIGLEPFPNGGFVNMGAYGGTPEASKAHFGEPICETIVAGDINGDCEVNRADLEIMALHWTDEEPMPMP